MTQQSLFNATPLAHKADWMPPTEQAALKKNAKDQESRVLAYFAKVSQASPSQVFAAVAKKGEPITSIRRAITNLTEAGRLEKLDVRVKGMCGKSEHVWRVVSGEIG